MILINQLDNKIGGTEKQTLYLEKYLAKSKIDFYVSRGPKLKYLNILRFYYCTFKLMFDAWRFKPKTVYIMTDIIASDLKDWLLITFPYLLYLAITCPLDIKVVLRICALNKYKILTQRFPQFILNKLYFITNCYSEKENILILNPTAKVICIPNGVNTRVFQKRKKRLFYNNDFIYGYIGRFSKEKNLEVLVEAYSRLPREIIDSSKLIMTGYDKNCCIQCDLYYQQLRQLIDKKGLSNFVVLKEMILFEDTSSIVQAYNDLDVYVLPSKTEGLSNSVVESIACEIPVVLCKKNKAAREITDRFISWTFIDMTANEMSKAMIKAYLEIEKTVPPETRQQIMRDYDINNTMQNTLEFLAP